MLKSIDTIRFPKAAQYSLRKTQSVSIADSRVVFLTNFIPPYRVPVLRALAGHLGTFRIFVSTDMEANRSWKPDWQGLEVDIQKSFYLRKVQRHPNGFDQETYVHLPYDTMPKLAAFNADVVISGEMGARTIQAVLHRIARPRSRLIIHADLSEHTERGLGKVRTGLRHWMLRHADAVLVNGESGTRYVRSLGVPDGKIFRVPYATDTSVYANVKQANDTSNVTRLLHVGQLIERKGIVRFLKRLITWCDKHPTRFIELILVGDGPLRGVIQDIKTPSNLRVTLPAAVAYSSMPGFYASADILVLPTLADSWALVVNEAMAAGLPVLGSINSQAVEELVKNKESGWIFNPNDSGEAYLALHQALSTPKDVRHKMGEKAREIAVATTPQLVAARMALAIDSCLNLR